MDYRVSHGLDEKYRLCRFHQNSQSIENRWDKIEKYLKKIHVKRFGHKQAKHAAKIHALHIGSAVG
jgi:hypothetical protein